MVAQNNKKSPVEATAQWLSNPDTKGGPVIGIRTRIGHTEENCDLSCNPKNKRAHLPCQGHGSECSTVGNIGFEPIVKGLSTKPATLTGRCLYPEDISDEETFAMPEQARFRYISPHIASTAFRLGTESASRSGLFPKSPIDQAPSLCIEKRRPAHWLRNHPSAACATGLSCSCFPLCPSNGL